MVISQQCFLNVHVESQDSIFELGVQLMYLRSWLYICTWNLYEDLYFPGTFMFCTLWYSMCLKKIVCLPQPCKESQFHWLFHSLTPSNSIMEPAGRGLKRKGGAQQRLRRTQEDLEKESALETLLATHLAQGILSANLVHGIVVAAAKDIQATKDGWKKFECIHSHKASKKNDLPSPFTVNIPF